MKKTIFIAALALSNFAFKADAQVKFNLNLNIGSQPEWGPTGYNHAEYYYMPDIDAYYYVPGHQYVYQQNNAWIRSGGLPPRFHNYDVYHGYKVVVNQPEPWRNQAVIRAKYAVFRGRHDQVVIRDSHDNRYQNHWHGDDHGRPNDNHGYGNDNGRRNDHGRPDDRNHRYH